MDYAIVVDYAAVVGDGGGVLMPEQTAVSLYSPLVERAMRFAAVAHRTHHRKGGDIPYLTHLASVTLILVRAGFEDDETLAAALLHDAVEDTPTTLGEIAAAFSPRVAELVAAVSEVKTDTAGVKHPWRTRKQEHLERMKAAPDAAKAILLADKLHNLGTLADDVAVDSTTWSRFNAEPADLLWYQRATLEAVGNNPRLDTLKAACRERIEYLSKRIPPPTPGAVTATGT